MPTWVLTFSFMSTSDWPQLCVSSAVQPQIQSSCWGTFKSKVVKTASDAPGPADAAQWCFRCKRLLSPMQSYKSHKFPTASFSLQRASILGQIRMKFTSGYWMIIIPFLAKKRLRGMVSSFAKIFFRHPLTRERETCDQGMALGHCLMWWHCWTCWPACMYHSLCQ